jgi:hypothetical protein
VAEARTLLEELATSHRAVLPARNGYLIGSRSPPTAALEVASVGYLASPASI